MSIEAMSKALHMDGLSSSEKLILVGIANHDGDGGAWPSVSTLAVYACVSERRVQQLIDVLVERGLVERLMNAGGTHRTRGDRRPNLYRLHLDGVKSETRPETDGVKSEAVRGEISDGKQAHGVKPTSPEPSLFNRPLEPSALPCDFDAFWAQWPNRKGRKNAETAFTAAVKKHGPKVIFAGLYALLPELRADHQRGRFCPMAATWLRAERWNDEPSGPIRPSSGTTAGARSSAHARMQERLLNAEPRFDASMGVLISPFMQG